MRDDRLGPNQIYLSNEILLADYNSDHHDQSPQEVESWLQEHGPPARLHSEVWIKGPKLLLHLFTVQAVKVAYIDLEKNRWGHD